MNERQSTSSQPPSLSRPLLDTVETSKNGNTGRFTVIIVVVVMMLLVSPTPVNCHSKEFFGATMLQDKEYDVIIYAATPAGFAAALAAKSSGAKSVLLLEPTAHVGGMASPGGIGLRDCSRNEVRTNNSTQYTWAMRNAKFYGVNKPVWQPDAWVGEKSFLDMLQEYDVELRLNTNLVEGSDGVETIVDSTGLRRISAIKLESGEKLGCKYFVDASYEGDVMIATGYVSYTYGREAKSKYNESFGGITSGSIGQFKENIDPYLHSSSNNHTLLKWVQEGPDPRDHVGEADENLMAYSFRVCLTKNTSNMVPITEPPGYDPIDFELARRNLLAEIKAGSQPHHPWGNLAYNSYPSQKAMKYDACCGSAPIGIDAVGLAVGYPTASRSKRKEIYERHKYYVQGLMWFWASDSAVPENLRNATNTLGLCKDEWPDNDHFPPQLYVREAARIIGDRVFTQNDRIEYSQPNGCRSDSIAIGDWGFDIHEMQRVVVTNHITGQPIAYNEGLTNPSNGGSVFYEIPYSILLPKKKEMVNLAVPNCPSATHVTFSSIRVEPTLWQLGQAAGTAAGVAVMLGGNTPLQDIDPHDVQKSLLKQKTFVHWPPTRTACT